MPLNRYRPACLMLVAGCALSAAARAGDWVTFTNETSTRLDADPALVAEDTEEKDYAWGDVDKDDDDDLVIARKEPFTTSGGRPNVLLLNEGGVLTDRTAEYIAGFLDATNDRDVKLVDVNNDTWLDLVTAAVCIECDPATVTNDSRLYLNLGAPAGTWLGFGEPVVLFGAEANNFCAVAAGDVTGDGWADLYFVSYEDGYEDQLLVNDGDGTFTLENGRLTTAMRGSDFGTNAVFADLDGDDDLDIVKSENGPVEFFRNNGSGFFDLLDPAYSGSGYNVAVGHLNEDGLLDVVIADDATDRYIINDGGLLDGAADPALIFPDSTAGFGGNSIVEDLDGDGWGDVLIADVDVDIPGCTRVSDILRNNADGFEPTFSAATSNIPGPILTGVHDIAVFDVDGDTLLDLVIGRCDTTHVLINSPPVAIAFGYPGGVPEFLMPNEATDFDVTLTPEGDTLDPGSPTIHISTNDGPYETAPLTPAGGDAYVATLPAGSCADHFDFYLSAATGGGLTFFDPPVAPASTYTAIVSAGLDVFFYDGFEGDVSAWTVASDASLTGGEWEVADPNATLFGNETAAPGSDASPDGTLAFVTENGPPNAPAGDHDVDEGPTFLTSPVFDLADGDGRVTYAHWVFSSLGIHDVLTVEVSNDGGGSWTTVETIDDTGSAWAEASFWVSAYVTPTDQVRVRFSIGDVPNDSVTEAAIDDFLIEAACSVVNDCPWDLDGDDVVGITDFLMLLTLWETDPGGPPDFDGDGTVGITDFLELLTMWGQCPEP